MSSCGHVYFCDICSDPICEDCLQYCSSCAAAICSGCCNGKVCENCYDEHLDLIDENED